MIETKKIMVLEITTTGVTMQEMVIDAYYMRVTPGEYIKKRKGKIPLSWRVAIIIAPELARTIESVVCIPVKKSGVINKESLEEYIGRAVTELFHRERSLVAKELAIKGSELVLGDVAISTLRCDGAIAFEPVGSTAEKEIEVALRVTIMPQAIQEGLSASMKQEQIIAITEREIAVLSMAQRIMSDDFMLFRTDAANTYCTQQKNKELRYNDKFPWSAHKAYETTARELGVDKKITTYCSDIYNEGQRTKVVHECIGNALRKELQLLVHGIEHASSGLDMPVVSCIDDARIARAFAILIKEHQEMIRIPMQIINEEWLWAQLGISVIKNLAHQASIGVISAALNAECSRRDTIMNRTAHRVMQWLHGNYAS